MPIKIIKQWDDLAESQEVYPATNPETASIVEGTLCYNIHKYDRQWGFRVDEPVILDIKKIDSVEIFLGANRAFKQIVINVKKDEEFDYLIISNTHKTLAREICKLLKQEGVILKTFVEKRKLRK